MRLGGMFDFGTSTPGGARALIAAFIVVCLLHPRVEASEGDIENSEYRPTIGAHLNGFELRRPFGNATRVRMTRIGKALTLIPPDTIVTTELAVQRSMSSFLPDTQYADFAVSEDGKTLWTVQETSDVLQFGDLAGTGTALHVPIDDIWKAIEASPDGQRLAVLGKRGHVAQSSNAGRTWEEVKFASSFEPIGIRLSRDGRTLFAAGSHGRVAFGLLQSNALQVKVCEVGGRELNAIAASSDGSNILAVGRDSYGCISRDHGTTWKLAVVAPTQDDDLRDVAFDSKTGGFLVVGDSGARASSNSKGEWRAESDPSLSEDLHSAAVEDQHGSALVVGGGGRLDFRAASTSPWQTIDDPSTRHMGFRSLAVSSDGRICIAGGQYGSLLVSLDGGHSFVSEHISDTTIDAIAVSPDGRQRFAADGIGKIYEWSSIDPKWREIANVEDRVWDLLIFGGGKQLVIATGHSGVWLKSENERPRVSYVGQGSPIFYSLGADAARSMIVVGGSRGTLAASYDGGQTWIPQETPTTDGVTATFVTSNGSVVIGTRSGVVFLRGSSEKTWSQVGDPIPSLVYAVAVYAGSVWYAGGKQIMLSRDGMTSVQRLELAGDVKAMTVGGGALWYATEDHEIGTLTKSTSHYPELAEFVPITNNLLKAKSNLLDLTFTAGDYCSASSLRFEARVGPIAGEYPLVKNIRTEQISKNRQRIYFDLPSDVTGNNLSLRLKTQCNNLSYIYTFAGLRTEPWIARVPGGWSTVFTVAGAVLLLLVAPLMYAFQPIALLWLRDVLRADYLPPWFAVVGRFLETVLLTKFLCRQPRVLDAWAAQNGAAALAFLVASPSIRRIEDEQPGRRRTQKEYLPLPVTIVFDDGAELQIERPTSTKFGKALRDGLGAAQHVQVLGVGGIGKTTFAIEVCRWIVEDRLLGYPAIPVLLPRDIPDIAAAFEKALETILVEQPPSQALIRDLVAKKRLVPVFDRVSELSPESRQGVASLLAQAPIALLTAREEQVLQGRAIRVLPDFLSTGSSLTSYIEHDLEDRMPKGLEGAERIMKPTAIANELSERLFGRVGRQLTGSTASSKSTTRITPLLASTFCALAVELLEAGGSIGELPGSMALTYVSYVRMLRRSDELVLSLTEESAYLLACSRLAAESMVAGSGPAPIPLDRARAIVKSTMPVEVPGLVEALVRAGLLQQNRSVYEQRIKFVVDSYAEALTAWLIANEHQECGRLIATLETISLRNTNNKSAAQVLQFVEDIKDSKKQRDYGTDQLRDGRTE